MRLYMPLRPLGGRSTASTQRNPHERAANFSSLRSLTIAGTLCDLASNVITYRLERRIESLASVRVL